ncbi:hypothetical protein BKA70DRAFT_1236344 [Coprinopsis sp. MPI-PUGE-AT-0042]|nr:hypothetical protein BKA70DRAFT_1236344 [Coprinopsis sp. MPI-PUGE-AT-0042]
MSLCDHTSCLPAEILLEIFKRALPGPLRQEGRFHFQSIRSVCSEWRLISFSSPILWSSLALFDHEIEPSVSAATAAERWLSRSGLSIPLELHLVYISYKGTPNEDYATFSNLIIRYQSRWKALLICGAGRCLWDSFNNAPSTGWTNLQKLSIWTRSLVDGSRKAGLQVLQACTSIQSTLLQHLQLFVFSEPVVRPADIGFISTYAHLRTLHLTMHQARVKASESSTTMITLQCLELLHMTCSELVLLNHLNTPALSKLTLRLVYSNPKAQDTIVRSFLDRNTKVHSVSLCGSWKTTAWMLPTLSDRPNLSKVTIEPLQNVLYVDGLLPDASWWNTWCPNLRELKLVVVSKGSIGEDEGQMKILTWFAAVLKRRIDWGHKRLVRLVFKCDSSMTSFPYELFGDLDIGEICVIVPW